MDDQDESEKDYIRHGEDLQLGVYHKPVKYYEKRLKIAMEKLPMQISVMHTTHWVTIEKQLSILKNV